MRLMRVLVLVVAAWMLSVVSAAAAELVMFRRDGCSYCAAWDRDIGSTYGKTAIGRRAPLRMVDIRRDKPELALERRVIYTPTFVLVDAGREIGRIEGYTGDHFFWGLLERLLTQLPAGAVERPDTPVLRDQRTERSR
jgi:thioredoxin-related protein